MKFIEIHRHKYMSEDGTMMFETIQSGYGARTRIYAACIHDSLTYSCLTTVQLLDRFASEVEHLPQANETDLVG